MAESDLSITYADLANAVAHLVGWGEDYSLLTDAQLARVNQHVQTGYRRFLVPPRTADQREVHRWSFLRPIGSLTTVAPYTTGTITITPYDPNNTTGDVSDLTIVTLTGGVWPSWAADAELVIGGVAYPVASRDGDGQLTLAVDGPESAAVTYSLARPYYTMPDDFGAILSPLTYQPAAAYCPIKVIREADIRVLRQSWNPSARPTRAAIVPNVSTTTTAGQRWRIAFYPTPDAAYLLEYRYQAIATKLDASYPYPLGGMQHGETIKAAVCAAAEMATTPGSPGPWEAMFRDLLATSISIDRSDNTPDYMNYNGEQLVDCPQTIIDTSALVTYNGQPT